MNPVQIGLWITQSSVIGYSVDLPNYNTKTKSKQLNFLQLLCKNTFVGGAGNSLLCSVYTRSFLKAPYCGNVSDMYLTTDNTPPKVIISHGTPLLSFLGKRPARLTLWSSSFVHGPFTSSGLRTFCQRCWHWPSVLVCQRETTKIPAQHLWLEHT